MVTTKTCFLLWVFAVGLSSAASSSFQDEKNFYNFYTPYINAGSPPPVVSYQNPSPDHAVYNQNPPPDHANEPPSVSSPPPAHVDNPPAVSYQNPPPVQPNNPPSGGGVTPPSHWHHHHHHHHGQKPPTNCDIPPSGGYGNPTPPPPTNNHNEPPSSGGGGGGGGGGGSPPIETPPTPTEHPIVQPPSPTVPQNPPAPPSGGCICGKPPSSAPAGPVVAPSPVEDHNPIPVTPRPGYHYFPPPATITTPPSSAPAANPPDTTPDGDTPSTSPPSPPTKPTTPKAKDPPATDGNTFPSPPFFPNIPFLGGTCDFWKKHPNLLSDLFKWWRSTFGRSIGLGNLFPGPNMNFLEALSNPRSDGISALYREGTASLLNSIVNKNFPFTTTHVMDSFLVALTSSEVAAAQAKVFKLANEGRLKPRV